MATTLALGATTITLPDDLLWPDEFTWAPVAQVASYGVTGALHIDAAAKLAGRPITLAGGDDYAWCPRSTLIALEAWKALPAQVFTLTLRGVQYPVIFDHEKGAVDAKSVADYSDPSADDPYVVTLRFLKV